MIEEIRNRFEVGYTLSVYGTKELLYEQMVEDISSLLILFDARNKAIENRIKELEADKYIDSEHKKQRVKELKNLVK